MTNEATERATMWRLKAPKQLVEQVDDLKYEHRVSRAQLVRRILRLGVKLWQRSEDGERSDFERLEEELFGADDCLDLDQGGC